MVDSNKDLSKEFVDKSGEIYDLLYGEDSQKKLSDTKASLQSALEQLSLDGNSAFMAAVKENSSPTLLMSIDEGEESISSSLSHAFIHPETNIKFMMEFIKQGNISEKDSLSVLSPLRRAITDTIHNLEIIFENNKDIEIDKFMSDHKKTLEILNPMIEELSTKLNIDPSTIEDVNSGCEHLNPINKDSFDIS